MHHLQQKQLSTFRRWAAREIREPNGVLGNEVWHPGLTTGASSRLIIKGDLLWKHARVPTRWKAQLVSCILHCQTLCSLDTLQPTEAAASKLNTFQFKYFVSFVTFHRGCFDLANANHETYKHAIGASVQQKSSVHQVAIYTKNEETIWGIPSER